MRNPTHGMPPLLRGLFGLVTAGLMVLIGATVYGDGSGNGRWIAYAFFALGGFRAYVAIREAMARDDDREEDDAQP